jgi:cysteine desulfurase
VTFHPVYLDHNATSPLRPAAAAAMRTALDDVGNPSSVHSFGQRARRLIDGVRQQIADVLVVSALDVIFTSGGTEANNLAVLGSPVERLLVSAVEHDSVLAAAHAAGRPFDVLPVGRDGRVDLAVLERLLANGTARVLVSVMFANNETGVVQPVAEVARLARAAGALFHCDAVQALGRLPMLPALLDADLVTLSAHKIGGPLGVGALVVRGGNTLMPQLHGGGQERFRRAGTQNVPGIAGFGAAIKDALSSAQDVQRVAMLRDEMEKALSQAGAVLVGSEAPRLPNTSAIAMPGVKSETQVIALDLDGIAVSAGAACSSGKVTRSHVLDAMQVVDDVALSTIRISLGWSTQQSDIDRVVAAWCALRERTRSNRGCDAA